MVSVPSPLETDDTAAAPEQDPQLGVARLPDNRHWAGVLVPARICNLLASDQTIPPALGVKPVLLVPPLASGIAPVKVDVANASVNPAPVVPEVSVPVPVILP